MNQIQIGAFIAECRKEKMLTQMQLAEKRNITNRAVSKWDTGKNLPDASIMMELCHILDISVTELLSGKKIETEKVREQSEITLMDLLDSDKRMKRKNPSANVWAAAEQESCFLYYMPRLPLQKPSPPFWALG